MGITWDPTKERKLLKDRGIDVREIAELIMEHRYVDILENPSRPEQYVFILNYHGYIHVAPFVIAKDETIVLKTVYPSRRFHEIYGEHHENQT